VIYELGVTSISIDNNLISEWNFIEEEFNSAFDRDCKDLASKKEMFYQVWTTSIPELEEFLSALAKKNI
jgi:hypothetical protein